MTHAVCASWVKNALEEEVESLRLERYWTFKHAVYLELEMKGINARLPRLQCKCPDCGGSEKACCRFRPFFIELLDSIGLTHAQAETADILVPEHLFSPKDPLQYGPGLLTAKYGSAALGKLDLLFELLMDME